MEGNDLDSTILYQISSNLDLADWNNFYLTCKKWFYIRPMEQYYAMKTPPFEDAINQFHYVLSQNNCEWLYWFLSQQRHRIPNNIFTSAIANSYMYKQHDLSRIMIDFDRIIYEKAEKIINYLDARGLFKLYQDLLRRTDYRLPYCRVLASHVGYNWQKRSGIQGFISDKELLEQIGKIIDNH